MNKLQGVLCQLLKKVVDILDSNEIEYWLAYGSVLGAVRHNGFIPWDDDVDIYINGKDYEKLQSIFKNGSINGLRLDDAELCQNYPFTFPKIVDDSTVLIEKRFENTCYRGAIYIDVFPLFSVNNNKVFRYFGYCSRYFNYAIVEAHYTDLYSNNRIRRVICRILRLFSLDKAQRRLMRRYFRGFTERDMFMNEPLQFNDKCLCYREHFSRTTTHPFEDMILNIPFDYDGYLTSQYGNYLELPPVEERVPCHSFVYIQYADGSVEKRD